MSQNRLRIITAGIMLSIFLASVEGTIIATAMPTIVGQLGGLSIYSWAFAVFMLASTTTVPIYGKLSDIYGRKQVYIISMILFLTGSVLCGLASSMEQLIAFRAVQGLGAGGVLPLAFTIIGELFDLEQRARMQGLFSGVWGVSSVIGPLIGGFLVDQISWQWVFFINIIPGGLAVAFVWFAWQNTGRGRAVRLSVDYAGAVLLTISALVLLLGLELLETPLGWVLVLAAVLLFVWLILLERKAEDPILPLDLFRSRLFSVSILHGILAGFAMFGSLTYVPLFVQTVLGTSATQAGITLTPMSLSWTMASIIGSRLLLKVGYRSLSTFGMVLLTIGAFLMTRIGVNSNQILIMFYLSLMGIGMGLSIPAFLIAVQTAVRKESMGSATSTVQFSRSIGGTFGVSVLGVYLSARLASGLVNLGLDPSQISLDNLTAAAESTGGALVESIKGALAFSIADMFFISFIVSLAALGVTMLAPGGTISQLRSERPVDQPEA